MNLFDWLNRALNFLFDASKTISMRLTTVILLISLGAFIDNQLGFSYYFSIGRKIEHVQKIEAIVLADTTARPVKEKLLQMEIDILNHRGVLSFLWEFTSLTSSAISSNMSQVNSTIDPNIIKRDNLWHFLSSTILFLIIMAMLPFFFFKENDGKITIKLFAELILTEFGLGVVALIINFLLLLIPEIPIPYFNYGNYILDDPNIKNGLFYWSWATNLVAQIFINSKNKRSYASSLSKVKKRRVCYIGWLKNSSCYYCEKRKRVKWF